MTMSEFPKCSVCERGILVPVETTRASGWVCTNPSCGFYVLLVDNRLTSGTLREAKNGDEDPSGRHNRN